jgi:hypothetical protein
VCSCLELSRIFVDSVGLCSDLLGKKDCLNRGELSPFLDAETLVK